MDMKDIIISELEKSNEQLELENAAMKDALARLGMLYISQLEAEAAMDEECEFDGCLGDEDPICDDCEGCCGACMTPDETDEQSDESTPKGVERNVPPEDDEAMTVEDIIRMFDHNLSAKGVRVQPVHIRKVHNPGVVTQQSDSQQKMKEASTAAKAAVKSGAEAVSAGLGAIANTDAVRDLKRRGKAIISIMVDDKNSQK